jgi:hypothetical protein
MTLNYERLELAADTGLHIMIDTADPGSRSERSLRLLGSRHPNTPTPDGPATKPDRLR